ncbi:MAG: DEAD/DEAH box helicase [Nitrososphaerota archaeon]|nr:DEAD/DEAH box helicase [Nitrososphaerota archaeon]
MDEVKIPDELARYMKDKGITELYPPQEQAVLAGLLDGKSLVVSAPTACYDAQTEVLTKNGWKLFEDTVSDEIVLSMNPLTFKMEYVKAVGKVEQEYTGRMVSVKGKEIDFRVTENHNMFACSMNDMRRTPDRARSIHPPASYSLKPAIGITSTWRFKSGGIWTGKRKSQFLIPPFRARRKGKHHAGNVLPGIKVRAEDWLNFLGWYMAEGNTKRRGGSYEVTLCQVKNPALVREAMERLGVGAVHKTGSKNHLHFSIYNPQLGSYLLRFGLAYEKYVPEYVKELPPDQIEIFLHSYRLGDGNRGRDGTSPVFGTTSKKLADDIQELLLKSGTSSSVRNRGLAKSHEMPDGHTIVSKHPFYEVPGRRCSEHGVDPRKPSKPVIERTVGETVYCLTLPKYHLLYVRRNGKAFWCGNSGKTLLALMSAYLRTKVERKKVVYLAPLRALASEKYSEFSELTKFGIRTAISTGDYDSSGESLGRADIIVLTNERFDSVMRHRVSWVNSVGLFVADEVHLAGNDRRGPTLEMILTKVIHLGLNAQLLALSATISNAKSIAEWLHAVPVELDWRPVPLKEGVYDYGRVVFSGGEEIQIPRSTYGSPIDVAMDTVKGGGQALIFASTRRRAVSLATRAAEVTQSRLTPEEKKATSEASRRILGSGEETSLGRLLAEVVAKGSAFHHAGLEPEHRRIVEEYYRARAIKLLAATPTLAAGVNLPARRVVIADMTRYDAERGGNAEISVLEYRQMAGRAGRPQYDDHGETVMVPPPSQPAADFLEHYTKEPPEPIKSRLSNEAAMRSHTLATIATGRGLSKGDLDSLFRETLLARQAGQAEVSRLTEKALGYLLSERLLESHGGLFYATDFGTRVSVLYVDPVTAVMFRNAVKRAEPGRDYTAGLLHLVASAPDFEPKFPLRSKDYEDAMAFMEEHAAEMLERHTTKEFSDYDRALQDVRSVMALHGWIDEWREEQLLSRLGVEPGDMHRAVDNADWLLHALGELCKLFKMPDMVRQADLLRRRVASGVGEELVELTALSGVGRVRARALYSAGFRTLEDLKEAPAEKLAMVDKVGASAARKIKEQVRRR